MDITLRTLSLIAGLQSSPAPLQTSLLRLFYPHTFLSLSLFHSLYFSLSPPANTEADNRKERWLTSNTVFTAIIIFASYLDSASSYLPFHRGTRAATPA